MPTTKWPTVDEVPDPGIQSPFDVIVRIGGAGLCRTDLHVMEGQWAPKSNVGLPYIIGHENADWIEAIGDAVSNVVVGDAMIVHPHITCGLCSACRNGDDMRCDLAVFPGD